MLSSYLRWQILLLRVVRLQMAEENVYVVVEDISEYRQKL
jgi:hypothetical protein